MCEIVPTHHTYFDSDEWAWIQSERKRRAGPDEHPEDVSISPIVRDAVRGVRTMSTETYTCKHCGRDFENAGAKATHESHCPEVV